MTAPLPDNAPIQRRLADVIVGMGEACFVVNVVRGTMTGWCTKYGVGNQMDPGSPWRIHLAAAMMIDDANRPALDAYKSGDREGPLVVGYVLAAIEAAKKKRRSVA